MGKIAIFCFEETELQRLWADVHTQNIASYKTLEKVGFKREGLIREGNMVNIYCDYYLYGMTKADYIEITDKRVLPFSLLSTEKAAVRKIRYNKLRKFRKQKRET